MIKQITCKASLMRCAWLISLRKGAVRNTISNETTLQEVIAKIKKSIKGEIVDVVTAKLYVIYIKPYASEIKDLVKGLGNAYISDGLPIELAYTYATKTAVKAIVKMPLMKRLDS